MMRWSAWMHWLLTGYLWLISSCRWGSWNAQPGPHMASALLAGQRLQAGRHWISGIRFTSRCAVLVRSSAPLVSVCDCRAVFRRFLDAERRCSRGGCRTLRGTRSRGRLSMRMGLRRRCCLVWNSRRAGCDAPHDLGAAGRLHGDGNDRASAVTGVIGFIRSLWTLDRPGPFSVYNRRSSLLDRRFVSPDPYLQLRELPSCRKSPESKKRTRASSSRHQYGWPSADLRSQSNRI